MLNVQHYYGFLATSTYTGLAGFRISRIPNLTAMNGHELSRGNALIKPAILM
ncbi:hypothetical protein BN1221_00709c [Brenneria goodwinii]|uniref:Uncharacterized protein n=1 Tax=Brenneria goodwinii TaxID=1109412 RepID=A0A0G4JQU7_9GAMM|nr:hypothetical protein BN1221_00709c [Brenneria goodwinii]